MKSSPSTLLALLILAVSSGAGCSGASPPPADASHDAAGATNPPRDGGAVEAYDGSVASEAAVAEVGRDVGRGDGDATTPGTPDGSGSGEEVGVRDPNCIVFVATSGSDTNDGTSWSSALANVQPAITAGRHKVDAGTCTSVEVWVAKGTYKPTSLTDANDARSATFQLAANIALYGGFAGTETTRPSRSIPGNVTTLSGDIGVAGDSTDNSYHVVTGVTGATIDGFTITGGFASGKGQGPSQNGGGMYNESASPTVTNCTFSVNSARLGGGMYNSDSSPAVTNCIFSDNTAATGMGAGMYNVDSSPLLEGCTFSKNSAETGGGMFNYVSGAAVLNHCTFSGNSATNGAGMYNASASPTVTSCTFVDNSARTGGGGMYNNTSSATVKGCTFSKNWAAKGGGMYNGSGGAATITDSTFSDNTAGEGGGGMYNYYVASTTVKNCTFANNSATGLGGGMVNYNASSPTVANCTFASNSVAGHGGGMANDDASSPKVVGCTFSGNTARVVGALSSGAGGGMYNHNSSSPTVTNCILSDNTAARGGGMFNGDSAPTLTSSTFSHNSATGNGGGIANVGAKLTALDDVLWGDTASAPGTEIYDDSASSSTVTFSIVAGGYAGTGNLDSDPRLGSDLRPLAGSPAIDSGACGATVTTTDILGNPRWDLATVANASGGNAVDRGAYEYQGTSETDALVMGPTCP